MKALLALLLLTLATSVLAIDFSGVLSWTIPEGDVARVEVGGETVWPSIPYVTNGLVAMWDGAWNAGIGRHDASAEKPIELVSGISTTLTGTIPVDGNAFLLGSGDLSFNLPAIVPAINEGHATIELVMARHGRAVYNGGYLAFGPNNTRGFWVWQNAEVLISGFSYHSSGAQFNDIRYDNSATNTIAFQLTTAATNNVFFNGTTLLHITRRATDLPDSSCYIGVLPTYNTRASAKVFAIRIYDRALTDDEISNNAAIDAVRFQFGSSAVNANVLSLSPALSPAIRPAAFSAAPSDLAVPSPY